MFKVTNYVLKMVFNLINIAMWVKNKLFVEKIFNR